MRIGNDRRLWTLTRESVKKASLGTGLPSKWRRTDRGHGCAGGFCDDDGIASDEVDISWAVHMVTKAPSKQHRPRENGGEQALDSAKAAPPVPP